MKNYLLILILTTFATACNFGKLPNKDLSKSNIEYVELSFPKGVNENKSIRLDSAQILLLSEILRNRKEDFVKPNNCYTLHIKLKNGGSVSYLTDGINFQGFDDSFDLPSSFKTQTDILKTVFNLQKIDNCK